MVGSAGVALALMYMLKIALLVCAVPLVVFFVVGLVNGIRAFR